MKKLLISSLTLLGIAGLSNIPTQAQTFNVGSSSSPGVTGAAVTINMNGAINAIAGQITFPEGVYATELIVDPRYTNDPTSNQRFINQLRLEGTGGSNRILRNTDLATGTDTSIESAIASEISTAGSLSDTVSLIRALGGIDINDEGSNPGATGAVVTITMNGSINAIASEITFPEGVMPRRLRVDPGYDGTRPDANDWGINNVELDRLSINDTALTGTNTSIESAIASEISTAPNISDTVSLIRSLSNNNISVGLD